MHHLDLGRVGLDRRDAHSGGGATGSSALPTLPAAMIC